MQHLCEYSFQNKRIGRIPSRNLLNKWSIRYSGSWNIETSSSKIEKYGIINIHFNFLLLIKNTKIGYDKKVAIISLYYGSAEIQKIDQKPPIENFATSFFQVLV